MTSYQSVRIHITLPSELSRKLAAAAKRSYSLRSDIVRLALLDWLAAHPEPLQPRLGASEVTMDNPMDNPEGQLIAPAKPKRKFPPPDEVLFKDLLTPDMTPEEMLALLMEYEEQYPNY